MIVSPSVQESRVGSTSLSVWEACEKPPPPSPNSTTAGMITSASIMMQPCTKSVRLTARKPPITV